MVVPESVCVLVYLPPVAIDLIYDCCIAKPFTFGVYVNLVVHYSKVKVGYGSVLLRQLIADNFTFAPSSPVKRHK